MAPSLARVLSALSMLMLGQLGRREQLAGGLVRPVDGQVLKSVGKTGTAGRMSCQASGQTGTEAGEGDRNSWLEVLSGRWTNRY